MKCAISGSNLKVFGRAIHALSRISDEMWFDPVEKGLALRSVNSSRSAYACIFFSSVFFQHYSQAIIHEQGQGKIEIHFKCKFAMKSVIPVFRCLNALERNVEKCNIYTNFNDCHVVFQLFCKHGITKTHNLTFQDCEPLQAVFVKHMCPNILKVQSRALTDIMIHFPTYQEEITLAVSPLKVSFKSYAEEVTEWTKAVRTEIHLSPDEFDYFQVGVDSEVTFCLKELRGFLTFAEATSTFISIHFGQCGKPIAFSVEDMVFEANFILATLTDSETSSQRSQLPTHSSIPTHSDTDKDATNEVAGKENCAETIMAKKKSGWSGRPNDGPRFAIGIRSPLMQKSRLNDIAASDGDDSMMEEVIPCSPAYQKGLSEVPRMIVEPRAAGHIFTETRILDGYTRFLQEEGFAEFCSLFFGAMSSNQQDDLNLTSYSLATASDSEEDCNNGQMSQTF